MLSLTLAVGALVAGALIGAYLLRPQTPAPFVPAPTAAEAPLKRRAFSDCRSRLMLMAAWSGAIIVMAVVIAYAQSIAA